MEVLFMWKIKTVLENVTRVLGEFCNPYILKPT